jgi:hypothetical protein
MRLKLSKFDVVQHGNTDSSESMVQARMTAVVRRLASSVPFGEGLNLSDKMMTSIPPEQIGRMMSGLEAAELILRLVQGRGRPRE